MIGKTRDIKKIFKKNEKRKTVHILIPHSQIQLCG